MIKKLKDMSPTNEIQLLVEEMPDEIKKQLKEGTAFLPDYIPDFDTELYLELRDERLIEEKYVRVGTNSKTMIVLVAIETSIKHRKKLNFPNYRMKKRIPNAFKMVDFTASI